MKFETIIFLVIAFNVVSALVKRRSKKAQAAKTSTPDATEAVKSPPKIRGIGQDILAQLAKELGLRLPQPAPVPTQLPKLPEENPTSIRNPSSKPNKPDPAPPPAEAPKPIVHAAAATVEKEAKLELPLAELRDPKRVRAALVLREILNPPVALRRK